MVIRYITLKEWLKRGTCTRCGSKDTRKTGITPNSKQEYYCNLCHRYFRLGGWKL